MCDLRLESPFKTSLNVNKYQLQKTRIPVGKSYYNLANGTPYFYFYFYKNLFKK